MTPREKIARNLDAMTRSEFLDWITVAIENTCDLTGRIAKRAGYVELLRAVQERREDLW